MTKKTKKFQTKHLIFGIGAFLVVLLSFANTINKGWAMNEYILVILVLLGVTLGILNICKKDVTRFLIAVIALGLMSIADFRSLDTLISPMGSLLQSIVSYLIFFMAPAAVVVSVKEIWVFLNE